MSQRFELNIYATECMGLSAHESIHPLKYQALLYQILPANDEVYAEHGNKRKERITMRRSNSISPTMRTRRRMVKAVRKSALLD